MNKMLIKVDVPMWAEGYYSHRESFQIESQFNLKQKRIGQGQFVADSVSPSIGQVCVGGGAHVLVQNPLPILKCHRYLTQ